MPFFPDIAMTEFETNKPIYKDGWRGTYLIIPIRVMPGKRFEPKGFTYVPFDSCADELSDKSDLLIRRCNSNYVNRYTQTSNVPPFVFTSAGGLVLSDLQVYLFENGIGFLTLFTFCHNSKIRLIYQFRLKELSMSVHIRYSNVNASFPVFWVGKRPLLPAGYFMLNRNPKESISAPTTPIMSRSNFLVT